MIKNGQYPDTITLLDIWVKTELKDEKNGEIRAPKKSFQN